MPIYMNIEGIEGDSTHHRYRNWHEVSSFSWGASNPSTVGSGGGGLSAGKVSLSDFVITKETAKGSPALVLHCCNGKHLPAVQLVSTVMRNEDDIEYVRYELTDCLVTSYSVSGSGEIPFESISINFTKITYKQTIVKPNGALEHQQMFWDLRKNAGG